MVVGRRVDAEGGFVDPADEDDLAGVQDAELLQAFELLDGGAIQRGDSKQEVTAICVQADVLMEVGRIGGEQVVMPRARVRDDGAAEVQGPLLVVEHHFHARRIKELFLVANRRAEGGHDRGWVLFQQFDNLIDSLGGDFRFVPLHIDDDVNLGPAECDLSDAVAAARMVRIGQHHVAAKRPHGSSDFFAIGRDANASGLHRASGGLISVLDERLAGLAEEQLARQSGRVQASGNHNRNGQAVVLILTHDDRFRP